MKIVNFDHRKYSVVEAENFLQVFFANGKASERIKIYCLLSPDKIYEYTETLLRENEETCGIVVVNGSGFLYSKTININPT